VKYYIIDYNTSNQLKLYTRKQQEKYVKYIIYWELRLFTSGLKTRQSYKY